MTSPAAAQNPWSDDELVAYLDGELELTACRQIDAQLPQDAALQRRVQELSRAWDLLNKLPRAHLGDQFTTATVELVAATARQEAISTQSSTRWRTLLRTAALACVIALVAGLTVFALMPDPNRRLLGELTILEHLDEYRQAGSIDFLRQLNAAKLLTATTDNNAPDNNTTNNNTADKNTGAKPAESEPAAAASAAPVSRDRKAEVDARLERVTKMSNSQQDELLRRQERFARLSPTEQQQLRDLDRDLISDPDRATLEQTLAQYFTWVCTLSPAEIAELQKLAPGPRLEKVGQLQARHRERRPMTLSPEDRLVLVTSVDELVLRDRPEPFKRRFEELTPSQRRRAVAMMFMHRSQGSDRRNWDRLTTEDVKRIQERLSPQAQGVLASVNPNIRQRILATWTGQALRHWLAESEPIEEAELARFFTEELDDQERDELVQLPGDEMQLQLRLLYLRRTLPSDMPQWLPGFQRSRSQRPGDRTDDRDRDRDRDKGPPRSGDKGPNSFRDRRPNPPEPPPAPSE